MDIFQVVVDLGIKLGTLAAQAYEASQAKDVEAHARAVKGMGDALDEAKTKLAAMDSTHVIQLQGALDTVAARFKPQG